MKKSERVTRYKGHVITEAPELGWSDSQQQMVANGFRVSVEGPHFNMNQQTYSGADVYLFKAIDGAIAKARGES